MTLIKVSVIVPCYNVEKYLRVCLDSLINQTLRDIEIICINDGSTDSTFQILQEYAASDTRIKIIDKGNAGPSAARNIGLTLAQGEFVTYVDSDDWIDLNFYEELYNAAKKYDAEIAVGSIYRPDDKDYFLKIRSYKTATKTKDKYKLACVPRRNYVVNKIYNRESLLNSGLLFNEGVYFEDIYWTPKVLHFLGKMVLVPDVAYYYRSNPNSIVMQKGDKYRKDRLSALLDCQEFIKRYDILCSLNGFNYWYKDYFKIFGLTLFMVKDYNFAKKYYLFGLLPVFERRTRGYSGLKEEFMVSGSKMYIPENF